MKKFSSRKTLILGRPTDTVRRILIAYAGVFTLLGLGLLVCVPAANAQSQPSSSARSNSLHSLQLQKEDPTIMTKHAEGTFEVKITPQKPDNKPAETANLGRMSIDKQFHGHLEATSQGEMLSAMTDVKGSAGYVAMERVSGTLDGRSGTFVLQHNGTMTRGTPQLSVTVVPDSGTGELAGLSGSMTINIDNGKHSYKFDYVLPEAHK